MSNLIKNIQNFAFQNNLWEKGAKIVLGVSGGPDSVCLLDIFNKLSKKYDFELHIVHVNYNLRGKDSKKDELFVKDLAKKYKIAIDALSSKKKNKGNLENNLRKIRYDYLEQIRKKLKFDIIAVAHNQDDQAETVLMRIIRGTGLNGLSAMKAKNGKIIRPLLGISRKEILGYLKKNKLKYRIDKSNSDTKFTRNAVRHKLIPFLEKKFNSSIKKTLSHWSFSVADDYEFINKNTEDFMNNIHKSNYVKFSAKNFLKLHSAIQRQTLRNIFQELKIIADVDNQQIEEISKIIRSTKNKSQKSLIGGLSILKKGDKVIMFLK
ncbi:MAG TPA: tRNA lysidine(34) synthetase TilS [Candidatus Moranbacteria bacterium]|nr:tRNA lysidine(34) synthetase TilS [Candidatus Moranbacteria bacterium]HRZ33579.1 tRNA lysidine(34) synthetase TilS [Candidatus Moranbacteria bacterium]